MLAQAALYCAIFIPFLSDKVLGLGFQGKEVNRPAQILVLRGADIEGIGGA